MPPRFTSAEVLDATSATAPRPVAGTLAFTGVFTDSRAVLAGGLFVALEGERFDGHRFVLECAQRGTAGAVVRRGVSLPALPEGFAVFAVEDTPRALGALGRAHRRRFTLPIGAVGGSNGKTTTKEMVGSILGTLGPILKTEGNFNNEVGVPLTLFRLEPAHRAAVLELGMNRPGEMARLTALVEPAAALLTTLQPEHLEGLGSLDGVARAEGELFEGLSAEATAVVNLDDALLVRQAARARGKRLTFGQSDEADVRCVAIEPRGQAGLRVTVRAEGRDWPLALGFIGVHNALNATGAFALGMALGVTAEGCVQGLEAARPYVGRLNVLTAPGGLTVLDDTYNANPSSMIAALDTARSLAGGVRMVAVLGDMLELGAEEASEHGRVGAYAAARADLLAFLGPRSAGGRKAAGAGAAHFVELDDLWKWLQPRLRPGDVVLVKGSRGMRMERVVERLTGTNVPGGH